MQSSRKGDEQGHISQTTATALVVVAALVGFWGGYLYRGQAGALRSRAAAPAQQQHTHDGERATSPFAQHDIEVHQAVLKKDPNNLQALVQLGNIYYDAQKYGEAIQYYTRALELNAKDVNVRTDLGTAYWYSNRPKEAVENFQLALQLQPNYPQTLFNLGVVRLHGLNDPEGAIAVWEKLLSSTPSYEPDRVRGQIEQARALLKVKNSTR